MEAGSVESFWLQSPRSFVVVMKGRAKAAKSAFDLAIMQAWHGEAFARSKRLEKLSKYLGSKERVRPQTPAEMLEVLRSFQSKGAGMNIRRVN